jgi:hypothetical protein
MTHNPPKLWLQGHTICSPGRSSARAPLLVATGWQSFGRRPTYSYRWRSGKAVWRDSWPPSWSWFTRAALGSPARCLRVARGRPDGRRVVVGGDIQGVECEAARAPPKRGRTRVSDGHGFPFPSAKKSVLFDFVSCSDFRAHNARTQPLTSYWSGTGPGSLPRVGIFAHRLGQDSMRMREVRIFFLFINWGGQDLGRSMERCHAQLSSIFTNFLNYAEKRVQGRFVILWSKFIH